MVRAFNKQEPGPKAKRSWTTAGWARLGAMRIGRLLFPSPLWPRRGSPGKQRSQQASVMRMLWQPRALAAVCPPPFPPTAPRAASNSICIQPESPLHEPTPPHTHTPHPPHPPPHTPAVLPGLCLVHQRLRLPNGFLGARLLGPCQLPKQTTPTPVTGLKTTRDSTRHKTQSINDTRRKHGKMSRRAKQLAPVCWKKRRVRIGPFCAARQARPSLGLGPAPAPSR
jgi:hypothetical protein